MMFIPVNWCQSLVLVTLVVFVNLPADATLARDDKKKPKKEPKLTPATESVFSRGLVSETVKTTDILKEYKSYCDVEREVKQFKATTLAYVTPWNSHGYDIAKMFAHKFTYVSPVWLQIQRRSASGYVIQGSHDIDAKWAEDVSKGGKVQIVPRVLFDQWTSNDFNSLFSSENEQDLVSKTLLDFMRKHNFQGIVLELWSQFGNQRNRSPLVHFITHLGEDFLDSGKALVLVMAPPLVYNNMDSGVVTRMEFEALAPYVTAFSLMTYDYSNPMRPGPNSPLKWMKACVETLVPDATSPYRQKILLGLNFYGNDYTLGNGNSLVGNQYIEILTKHKPKLKWESESQEHVFKYKPRDGEHTVYYPTLQSINKRIQLAQSLGTGLSIWEIGQGLDYFYDLL